MARKSPKINKERVCLQILKYDLKQEVETRVAVGHASVGHDRDVLWRQGQAGCELPACLSYIARPCLERKVRKRGEGRAIKQRGPGQTRTHSEAESVTIFTEKLSEAH